MKVAVLRGTAFLPCLTIGIDIQPKLGTQSDFTRNLMLIIGEPSTYTIDGAALIQSVDEAWLQFARENGAPELTREAVIGKSLWDFMSSSDTQNFYRAVFHRVRSKQIEVTLPFRCDSPELLRFMELHLRPGSDDSITLCGRLLRQEERDYVPLINSFLSGEDQKFTMCSLCKRVNAFGDWMEPEEAVKRFHIFETAHEPQLAHSVCNQCAHLARVRTG